LRQAYDYWQDQPGFSRRGAANGNVRRVSGGADAGAGAAARICALTECEMKCFITGFLTRSTSTLNLKNSSCDTKAVQRAESASANASAAPRAPQSFEDGEACGRLVRHRPMASVVSFSARAGRATREQRLSEQRMSEATAAAASRQCTVANQRRNPLRKEYERRGGLVRVDFV
jgi:hypothetical protein